MTAKMLLLRACLIAASMSLVASMMNIAIETDIHFMKTIPRSKAVHIMKIVEEQYRQLKTDINLDINQNSTCFCFNYSCGCCVQLVVEKISLNETGCVNISYLPDEYGFQFLFTLNGKVIIGEKISGEPKYDTLVLIWPLVYTFSVKNPPPICAAIPYAHQLASICIRFYNLDYKEKQFSGCADIEVELERVVIKQYDLGCIHIPPKSQNHLN